MPSLEIDSDSDNYPTATIWANPRDLNGPWLASGHRQVYLNMEPIQDVIVKLVQNPEKEAAQVHPPLPPGRYQKMKPLWLRALIKKEHLGRGENTSKCSELSEVIRNRGDYKNDDCGHIIASSLGGKMLDANLFPQDKSLNRGLKGTYWVWRLIEWCMKKWVQKIPEKYHPRVDFVMLLEYKDPNYVDRPNAFKYSIQFLMDDDDSSSDDDDDDEPIEISQVIVNMAMIALQCREAHTLKKSIMAQVKNYSARCEELVDEFLAELLVIVGEIEIKPNTPPVCHNSPPIRRRNLSFWDFIPVVGSFKTLIEGCEDLQDGNIGAGVTNLLLGSTCLMLDAVTIGGASTVVKTAGKVLAKETAKSAAKQIGKEVTIKVIEKTGQAAMTTLASATVSNKLKKMKTNFH